MESTVLDLKQRRSIRSYLPKQISDEKLSMILEAGTYAPTGMGGQSPKIVAVQNPDTIRRLSELNLRFLPPEAKLDPLYGAPSVLVVLADPSRSTWLQDGSLVMGNLMNAAYAVGVGSCWVHRAKEVFDSEDGKALLREWGVPDTYVGVGHCILGYPVEELSPAPAPRKQDYIVYVK